MGTGIEDPENNAPLSRRGALLALGGAAAGAAGMAVGSALLGAEPAAAANGDTVTVGGAFTGSQTTQITTTGGNGLAGITSETGYSGVFGQDTSSAGSNGVAGVSNAGIGVSGKSHALSGLTRSPAGIIGDSDTNDGVIGLSSGGVGVIGISVNQTGVYGSYGQSGLVDEFTVGVAGVLGDSHLSAGVIGASDTLWGIWGLTSASGYAGVLGQDVSTGGSSALLGKSNSGIGVYGLTESYSGLVGDSVAGVIGDSGSSPGVIGLSSAAEGIFGETSALAQVGVRAANTANGPQLLLLPAGAATLPATATPGQFIVLSDGSLHYCETANEWITLGTSSSSPSIVTIDPVRVINTVSGTGGITGPLTPGSTVYTSDAIAGTNGIPGDATAIVGNFAISGVGGALLNGYGTATIFPAGIATPATANINSGAGCFAISNSVTVGFGTGGEAGKLSIVWSGGGPVPNAEAFLDVTGYIL
jgi:hypothetical protein